METNEAIDEGEGKQDANNIEINKSLVSEYQQEQQAHFNKLWGYVDLAMNVAKETGVSYFEIVNKPAIEVLTLSAYMIDKIKQMEARYKTK